MLSCQICPLFSVASHFAGYSVCSLAVFIMTRPSSVSHHVFCPGWQEYGPLSLLVVEHAARSDCLSTHRSDTPIGQRFVQSSMRSLYRGTNRTGLDLNCQKFAPDKSETACCVIGYISLFFRFSCWKVPVNRHCRGYNDFGLRKEITSQTRHLRAGIY